MSVTKELIPDSLEQRTLAAASRRKSRMRRLYTGIISYGWVGIICLTTLLPFTWMISTSFKPRSEILFYRALPLEPTLENYVRVLTRYPFGRWYLNTTIVTLVSVASTLLFCALAGYALAKFRFFGRDVFFTLILATVMVPVEMLIIPWYVGAYSLNLDDTYPGLVFPGLISAFGVFILRQAIINIPDELIDAARIDGLSEIGIFFRIILPLSSGALAALGILTALNTWNDFLWPLIIVKDVDMYTLQLGVSYAATGDAAEGINDWGLTMSATTIASVPMLILVIVAQKYLVRGIALSGLKG